MKRLVIACSAQNKETVLLDEQWATNTALSKGEHPERGAERMKDSEVN